ncbi:MAG: pirin family protein [Planctomycetota bacterium]|nr:pirin family protein [Planctomycetota bacterium]
MSSSLTLFPGAERGHTRIDWLDSRHSFSFGSYVDSARMGYQSLRVLNDDRVAAGGGFGKHPHRDMEIVTYVLDGALEHADSMGNRSVLRAGSFQRMTAGRGVTHSEWNHSKTDPVHFLQIWIEPAERGLEPGYEEGAYEDGLVASPDGRDGSLTIHQDARIHLLRAETRFRVESGRHAWLHVATGAAVVAGHALTAGDAAAASDTGVIEIAPAADSRVLLFDLG